MTNLPRRANSSRRGGNKGLLTRGSQRHPGDSNPQLPVYEMPSTPEEIAVDKKGIPLKSAFPDGTPIVAFVSVIHIVFLSIGTCLAYAVYTWGDRFHYDHKIRLIAANGLGWTYCGLLAFKVCSIGISMVSAEARKESKVHPPDQHVYKVFGGPDTQGYVLLEHRGAIGRFNRAQRANFNHLESLPYVMLVWLFASFVFPFPSFVAICVFATSRIHFASGYTREAKGRDTGQQVGYLCISVLEGLCVVGGGMAMVRQM